MTTADTPLKGHSVLITRPAGRGATLARCLRSLGARVVEAPTIAFEPPDDADAPRRAVAGLGGYDWIVFSSGTGVEFFQRRMQEAGREMPPANLRVAAVGRATARHLEQAGIAVQIVASPSHAEGLAECMRELLRAGDRVLWVRPEVARPVLRERLEALGARVDGVVFYRTVAAPGAADVARSLHEQSFDAIVFTSPSTFQRLADADVEGRERCLESLRRSAIVAIGPITAAALAGEGLAPAAVAETAGDEAVVQAVRRALGGSGGDANDG
jgi:uroporphyrinogen-III synthase